MASIELAPLSAHLDDDEIDAVLSSAEEAGVEDLDMDEEGDSALLERDMDEDLFADFFDQLDANDAACDVYLPGEFEDTFEAGGYRIGSAHALVLILEELKEDFSIEDEDDDEGESVDFDESFDEGEGFGGGDSEAMELKEQQFRHMWRILNKGARSCIARSLCLFVHQ